MWLSYGRRRWTAGLVCVAASTNALLVDVAKNSVAARLCNAL